MEPSPEALPAETRVPRAPAGRPAWALWMAALAHQRVLLDLGPRGTLTGTGCPLGAIWVPLATVTERQCRGYAAGSLSLGFSDPGIT